MGLPGNVEFLILGPLEARIGGRPLALGAPRQRLLLAALLLAAPAPLRREQLIDEMWGPAPPASARHAVEVYVSRLRGALGAAAIASAPGPSYAAAGPVDARRFEKLASGERCEAQLVEALALWRGPVLADFAYEGSLRTEIARLQELRLAARKTRLALGAAEAVVDDFADGVHFVDLSPLRDPTTVAPAVAHAVGLDAETELVRQLRDRRALLVLDNFEQVLDAAPAVGALLAGAPGVRVLATSRTRLDIYGEHEFAVDPLGHDEGVELFCARARARDRRFVPTAAVADVLARVERLPLAIELVAARADRMSVEEMAAGLPILELATGGPRDVPDRHRALRAAIDWSLQLLDEPERRRFAAMGVFAGGLDAAAAAAVLDATPADLDRLAGHSLLRRLPGRWAMLETLRERALELLDVSAPVRARHVAYYLELAERSEPALKGADQAAWGERVEREHDNLRAALRHAEPRAALRIAAALGFFWYTHGHSAEGVTHLERTLAAAGDAPPLLRGRGLHALGILRAQRGDERAEATFREGLAMFRAAGDRARVAVALNSLGVMARERGDVARARAAFEEASDAYRSLGDRRRLSDSLSNLAFVAIDQGQLDEAEALFAESITLDRAFDNQWGVAQNLSGQAALALARGAPDESAALLAQAVQALRPLGDRPSLVAALERLAATAAVRNDHAFAARLWGAATAQRDAAGEPRTAAEAATIDRYVDASRAALGPERFAAAATGGAALDLEAALAEALAR